MTTPPKGESVAAAATGGGYRLYNLYFTSALLFLLAQMPKTRTKLARTFRTTALYLLIGLFLTITISWSLAAFMPQRNWRSRLVEGWSLEEPANGDLFIEQFEATGGRRRTWELHAITVFKLPLFQPVIDDPPGDWESRTQFDKASFPLGWPRWGRAEPARNWYWAHRADKPQDFSSFPSTPFPEDGCEHATGWPVLALWYEITLATNTLEIAGGIPLQPPTRAGATANTYELRALPYHPIYPGLILNSIFWATIAFALTRLALFLRATNRKRKNLCPTCAYDLRNNATPGCPECGWNRPAIST